MEKEKTAQMIAYNIQRYRKHHRLTQLELATKLNYSDKTVSKWERAEGVPDIYVLSELATFFGIKVDDFLNDRPLSVPISTKQKKHLMVTLTVFASVWVLAVIFYAVALMASFDAFPLWYTFIVALPVSFIVLVIFTAIWGNYKYLVLPISLLIWSIALTLTILIPVQNSYLFFIIAIPIHILFLLIFFVIRFRKKEKLFLKNLEE